MLWRLRRLMVGSWMLIGASVALAQVEPREVWRYRVNGFIRLGAAAAINPAGTAIYVGVETAGGGRIAALTPAGDRLWEFERTQPFDATPVVGPDGTIYVGCVDGRFYALRPGVNEQQLKWSVDAGSFISSSAAMSADGSTLYFGTGDGRLFAVATTGEVRWTFQTDDSIFSSPAIAGDGTIYFGSTDGVVYAVRPDGTGQWRVPTRDAIFSSPAIGHDGTVYIGSWDQSIYAIAADGTVRWEFFTNGVIDAAPALAADGTVYVPSGDGNFYALNPRGSDQQRVKWTARIGVTSASSPAVRGDGLIIFGADDNRVRALNPADGSVRWTFTADQSEPDDGIEAAPLVAPDGAIYVGSLDGNLYKLNGNGSPLSTVSSWPAFRRDPMRRGQGAVATTGTGRLFNLSTRARIDGTDTLIVGFVAQGVSSKAYLVRAVGPALAQFEVGGFMPDPRLEVFVGATLFGQNDNWNTPTPLPGFQEFGIEDTTSEVGAFPLLEGSKDAAVVPALQPGEYTAHATAADGAGGVVLVEAYDANAQNAGTRLVNLSTRGRVGAAGEDNLFAGFVVAGTRPVRVLLRGVGPGLTQFGIVNPLQRPSLSLFPHTDDPNRAPLATNSGWAAGGISYDVASSAELAGAFSLPAGSTDAAIVTTLVPGAYTIQISGVNSTTGDALAEIYLLP